VVVVEASALGSSGVVLESSVTALKTEVVALALAYATDSSMVICRTG
jgi:hypothetical protein